MAAASTSGSPGKPPLGRRVVVFVVAAAALAVLIATATGDRGYFEARRRRAEYAGLQAEVDSLRAENAALMADVTALKTSPYAIEKLARERLGYARPGEVVYLFPPAEAGPPAETAPHTRATPPPDRLAR